MLSSLAFIKQLQKLSLIVSYTELIYSSEQQLLCNENNKKKILDPSVSVFS
jgi:hypothetical protein